MKTEPSVRDDGSIAGFGFAHTFVSIRLVKAVLHSVAGVANVRRRHDHEERVAFEFHGVPCTVIEPWGDSSEYWISPKDIERHPIDMAPIHAAFAARSRASVALEWLAWVLGAVAVTWLVRAAF